MAATRTPLGVLDPLVKADFAKILKKARESAGFDSAEDFAALLGVEGARYRYWERGDAMPSVAMVVLICQLLNIEPNDLLPRALRQKVQLELRKPKKNGRSREDAPRP